MKVHRALGPGFLESVYRNALAFELRRAGLSIELDQRISVRYENVIVGDFIADLLVNDTLICELKAISALTKPDEVQVVNYLTATRFRTAFEFRDCESAIQASIAGYRPPPNAPIF